MGPGVPQPDLLKGDVPTDHDWLLTIETNRDDPPPNKWDTFFFWGSNLMQIYGDFEGFPL